MPCGNTRYVPWTNESAGITACGTIQKYNASSEWADKKVVLFSVPGTSCQSEISDLPWMYIPQPPLWPILSNSAAAHSQLVGAFTPSCSIRHLPGYIENLPKIKEKGVDIVAVTAFNDAWVMSAWGKANNIDGDDIVRILPALKQD